MRIVYKLLPFLTLLILSIAFFNKTLTGSEFFVTPDFGGSDILMAEYPAKFFLAESLKQHQLPLWNPQIATGFPQAGTITGSFNPVNLILFYLLETPLAFNLGLAITFLTAGIFIYLFCRSLNLSKFSSLLAATSFSFSGVFVTQINHFSLIQTLSFFPIELYLTEIYIQKRKLFICVLLAFAIGLQILAGFFQIVLYSLIVLVIYIFLRIFYCPSLRHPQAKSDLAIGPHPTKGFHDKYLILAVLGLSVITGFLVAAIQLLPSWEFTQISTRSSGVSPEEIKRFPYPAKHLVTFLWPYLLGDPRAGTYPKFSPDWGIFWENTGYIGALPLVFAAIAVFFNRAKNKIIYIFLATLIFSLLLMLGKNSPTFFLFQFPPLSLFRVPARFIIFFTFALCILAAFGFDIIRKNLAPKITPRLSTVLWLAILLITAINLFLFSYFYNPRGQTEKWLAPTQTARFLKKDTSLYRIDGGRSQPLWNEQFLKKGWPADSNNYLAFLEALDPNWNVTQNITHLGLYPIIRSQREKLVANIKDQDITKEENTFVIGQTARNLLDLANVKYIVSPFEIVGDSLDPVFQSQTKPPYFIYQNKTAFPRAFVVNDWLMAQTPNDYSQIFSSEKFDRRKTTILEKTLPQKSYSTKVSSTKITKYENQLVEIEAQTDSGGILVLADSFYPGWKAYVDGQQVEILAANINQRAVVLEKGKHNVQFVYQPESFRKGAIISITTTTVLLVFLVFSLIKSKHSRN